MANTPSDVDDYLAGAPDIPRATLEQLRKTIKAAVPEAGETISYQMPTFKYRGRFLVSFAAFKNHCSLFPLSGDVLDRLGDELKGYEQSGKGTLRFPLDKPLPAALLRGAPTHQAGPQIPKPGLPCSDCLERLNFRSKPGGFLQSALPSRHGNPIRKEI